MAFPSSSAAAALTLASSVTSKAKICSSWSLESASRHSSTAEFGSRQAA